jgi:hypothetical protein
MENGLILMEKNLDNIRLGCSVYIVDPLEPAKKEKVYNNEDDPFVTAFIDYLFKELLFFTGNFSIRDILNTLRVVGASTGHQVYLYSITFGTGTNAVALTDYALQTEIVNGVSANQLLYGSLTWSNAFNIGATTKMLLINRPVINMSGGAITVNEMCLQFRDQTQFWNFMAARDIIVGGIVVPNGSAMIGEYRLSITV